MFIQLLDELFWGLKAVEEIINETSIVKWHKKFKILFKTYLNLKTELNNKWEGNTCSKYDKRLISLLFKKLIKMEARGERKDYLKQRFNRSWLVLIPKCFWVPCFCQLVCDLYVQTVFNIGSNTTSLVKTICHKEKIIMLHAAKCPWRF